MHLKSVTLSNIRSIGDLTWEVPLPKPGWNVIIGDNGAGKSTFLRAQALALVGPNEAAALRQNWDEWLRVREPSGSIEIHADFNEVYDKFTGRGPRPRNWWLNAILWFRRSDAGVALEGSGQAPERTLWGTGAGWFSASYGPLAEMKRQHANLPKLARLFAEAPEALSW